MWSTSASWPCVSPTTVKRQPSCTCTCTTVGSVRMCSLNLVRICSTYLACSSWSDLNAVSRPSITSDDRSHVTCGPSYSVDTSMPSTSPSPISDPGISSPPMLSLRPSFDRRSRFFCSSWLSSMLYIASVASRSTLSFASFERTPACTLVAAADSSENGATASFGTKAPYFSRHVKYRFDPAVPFDVPVGFVNSTPTKMPSPTSGTAPT
mmetsp:Transcript_19458/g.68908  ORF Transcript_19458/g.68908 Transcript_19458/m.68908 type:complete len:209 (-) Transcript_19458:213-839(-)